VSCGVVVVLWSCGVEEKELSRRAEEEEIQIVPWILQAGAGTRCLARLPDPVSTTPVVPCAVSMPKGQATVTTEATDANGDLVTTRQHQQNKCTEHI